MTRALRAVLATALAATAAAQAPTVTTVLGNGTTQSRYDMVILGDGYQAHEQVKFDQDVQTFLAALFQKQPYQTFAAYYNAHTVFRASAESGADRPDENPPVYRNTVYNATYDFGGTDRCLYIQNTSQALADAALAPANEGRILVLVNDTRYGGCAATFAVSYTGSQMSEVQIHELGHSVGQLADEYDYPNGTYTGPEPSAPNITRSATGQKWAVWHGTDGIGAFEGAGYHAFGLYRPRINCLMRALGTAMCRVCQENVTKITSGVVDTIVSSSPATTNVTLTVPAVQTFSFTHIVPAGNNPVIRWRIDGTVVPGATATSLLLDSTTLAVGPHTVECSVLDQTPLVRTDPQEVMRETHTWQVTVADPTAAQLRVPMVTTDVVWVQPGGALTINATITNDGPAAAGPFAVEFFLAQTGAWSVQDPYLGSVTVPTLAALQSTVVQHTVALPWSLPPVVHYGFVVVDRLGVVHEANENDNERSFALIGQPGGCVTRLEYTDPLLYPHDAAALSLPAGGTLHPTVVAPCANPQATLYLIAWGGSGTTPGLSLAPAVTLPLNPDALTQLGLDHVNGPVFGAFLGLLDAQGLGRATFVLPPGLPLGTGPTHFAAVLLGNTELFAAATNAIRLDLLP